MQDGLQQALQAAAYSSATMSAIAAFCATYILYLMGVALLVALFLRRERLTVNILLRIALMAALAFGLSLVLGRVIPDTRPYLVTHIAPLVDVAADNGFPSDHVLLAATVTTALWWLDRRLILPFAVATLLIMLARMGVGAHHTLDVIGSVAIVLVAFAVAVSIPLPTAWDKPLLARAVAA